jgi:hypothetical protein
MAVPSARTRDLYQKPVRRALVLDHDVYSELAFGPSPMKRGFQLLLAIIGIVVLSKIIGWLFAWLVMPRIGALQAPIQDFIVGLPWYADQVAQSPDFPARFQQTYALIWEGIRTLAGQPTVTSLIGSELSFIATTLGAWLGYSALAQLLARWFGGEATFRKLAGALALTYAPLLLLVLEVWPGIKVPATLMFLLLFICKYLAIRRVHGLPAGYTLAVTAGPYLLTILGLLFLSLFGLSIGLQNIPGIGQLLGAGGALSGLGQ